MHEHAMLLLDPDFHSTGTNHGMFQDHALLAWATSAAAEGNPEARDALTTATDRLVTYLDGRISGDGVHLEHSPAYHQLIAQNMRRYGGFFAAAGDLASRAAVDSARARMLAYATHVIQPDGAFPLVGDTFTHDRPDPELFDDPAYRFAVTSGREGVAPSDTDAYFLDAGYAIMRDAWRSDGRGTYIHFSAAYHGDYHKHADDLSVWLYHDGPLLTEAGPNGYDYGDPFTVYGFGASSHNVVLVDDEGVPRTDGQTALVGLVDASRSGRVSTASGSTRRLPGVAHTRTVRYDRETSVVTIVDELTAVEPHRYTLVWHLAAGVDARPSAAGFELGRDGGRVATLRVDGPAEPSFQILRGEQREDGTVVGGWRLGGGEPSPSVTLHFDFAGEPGTTTITTTIQLAED
jgi:hypothetical protein